MTDPAPTSSPTQGSTPNKAPTQAPTQGLTQGSTDGSTDGSTQGPTVAERLKPVQRLLQRGASAAVHWSGIAAAHAWIVLKRLPIATYSFIRALADANYARLLTDIYADGETNLPGPTPSGKAPLPRPAAQLNDAPPDSALVLLGLLQKEGRLVDFLHEEINAYSDQEIGAAARVVHDGCQRVLKDYLSIAPVRHEAEGSRITLLAGFDAAAVRPIGNVVGEPPFTGALIHRGWRADAVNLPKVVGDRDVSILAPAEVEL